MDREQLARHLGDVDEDLLRESAAPLPRRRRLRPGAVLLAAALAVSSFVAGALAFDGDTAHRETVGLPGSGITLILPDWWAGRYETAVSQDEVTVYHTASRRDGGILLTLSRCAGTAPLDADFAAPGRVIAATDEAYYVLSRPSDVQWGDGDAAAAYHEMAQSVADVQILLSDWMSLHSVHAGNWVPGTVYVDVLRPDGTAERQIVLDEDGSAQVRALLARQRLDTPDQSFRFDLWIRVNGQDYCVDSGTGRIMAAAGAVGGVLPEEDRAALTAALGLDEG